MTRESRAAFGGHSILQACAACTRPALAFTSAVMAAFVMLVILWGGPVQGSWVDDQLAHSKLTDGVTASPEVDDPGWVTFYADETVLPKTRYNPGEFSFWGMNAPIGLSPSRNPDLYIKMIQANIKGVRYDTLWNAAQANGPGSILYNFLGFEDDINTYIADGFSIISAVGNTPGWANGLHDRMYPPNRAVESELIDLTGGTVALANKPLINTLQDIFPLVVTPENYMTVRVEEEVITTNFYRGLQPRCSKRPVVVGSQQVWVDENDGSGWVLWTPVDNLINSPDGARHYEFDRSGRVKFLNQVYFYFHGRTPKAGSKVKISYDYITTVYSQNADYTVNALNGTISRIDTGTVTGHIPEEGFDSAPLDGRWEWMNAPASWDVGTTTPGVLTLTSSASSNTIGHFLHQNLEGDGYFNASLRVTQMTSGQCGIGVYQDANNWFRYGITSDAGRPYLVRCQNGTVTTFGSSGQLGFQIVPPTWIGVRRRGNDFTVFTSKNNPNAPDGGFNTYYSFSQTLNYPLKVGVSTVGASTVGLDTFRVSLPGIPADSSVRVFYNYMDTKPFTDFLKPFVSYYKDRIKFWEIWNEPDQGWVWLGGQDLYAILLRDASRAIKEADPEAQISSGGYANDATHNLATVYATIGNSDFDYVAWHPYNFSNRPPDSYNWPYSNNNTTGRNIMTQNGDYLKQVFFGEFGSTSGVLAAGGGLTDRKQAEFGLRLLFWTRKLGYPKGVQWYPPVDEAPVGQGEDSIWREHAGIFYFGSSLPKPSYYTFASAAGNKGVLLDLVSYDAAGNSIPAQARYALKKVSIGVQDRANLQKVSVLTSLSATSPDSRPPKVAARPIGQSGAGTFVVTVSTGSPQLAWEKWTATAISPTEFQVVGSVSGEQGIATMGVPFVSANAVAAFTIPTPPNPYLVGDRFEFETFAGDGFAEAGQWVSTGETGAGLVEIDVPQGTEARYVSIRFTKATGAHSIKVDEIQVFDAADLNVAVGKLYIVDGYQKSFDLTGSDFHLSDAAKLPDGTSVTLTNKVLHFKQTLVGYVEELDRSSGIRIDGDLLQVNEDDIVSFSGILATTPGGERRILLDSITTVGQGAPRPLAANNRDLKNPMMNGLYVKAYGKVIPGTIGLFSFKISDGTDPDGILISYEEPPLVQPGQFVTVTGAAGYDNGRVIYQR